ncbi:hypothetical protein, partial [Sutcliffiella cohnii]|uniref:hypothetical protein n=1 Tax=Sutcliffiella cohnii TaxID=33932 RepID=UPI001C3F47BB
LVQALVVNAIYISKKSRSVMLNRLKGGLFLSVNNSKLEHLRYTVSISVSSYYMEQKKLI